jgi:hypothetical protein
MGDSKFIYGDEGRRESTRDVEYELEMQEFAMKELQIQKRMAELRNEQKMLSLNRSFQVAQPKIANTAHTTTNAAKLPKIAAKTMSTASTQKRKAVPQPEHNPPPPKRSQRAVASKPSNAAATSMVVSLPINENITVATGHRRIEAEAAVDHGTSMMPIDLSTPPPEDGKVPHPLRASRVDYSEAYAEEKDPGSGSDLVERKRRYRGPQYNHEPVHAAFPTVCQMEDGSIAELHCCECSVNASFREGKLKMLGVGKSLRTHYVSSHPDLNNAMRLSPSQLMKKCIKKTLNAKEVEAVKTGNIERYVVDVVLSEIGSARYRNSRSQNHRKFDQMPDLPIADHGVNSALTASTAEDHDDEEQSDAKPQLDRESSPIGGPPAGDVHGAALQAPVHTSLRARKTAPGGGLLAEMWYHGQDM